ncbi:unnamed protein product [Spirodela intermedia]|uniref:ALOG domain-containing protein n=1 Tax=Spirodela intermedia TaxID=51605 RepID=A0A7I8IAV2_SPIIN|nr:unnamed protein product [Spirodela intermedia]CAA6654710.1 unnamed protein product [Spirodela intermedia]
MSFLRTGGTSGTRASLSSSNEGCRHYRRRPAASPSATAPAVSAAAATATATATASAPASAAEPIRVAEEEDWNTFLQYLRNHKPPLSLSRCSGAHVIEFLKYLDQFGKTKVHVVGCPFFGHPNPPASCACPLKQAWGSLDALIGRLRAAYEENGGSPESNPFGARPVGIYLREVRSSQAKARAFPTRRRKESARRHLRRRPQHLLPLHKHLEESPGAPTLLEVLLSAVGRW